MFLPQRIIFNNISAPQLKPAGHNENPSEYTNPSVVEANINEAELLLKNVKAAHPEAKRDPDVINLEAKMNELREAYDRFKNENVSLKKVQQRVEYAKVNRSLDALLHAVNYSARHPEKEFSAKEINERIAEAREVYRARDKMTGGLNDALAKAWPSLVTLDVNKSRTERRREQIQKITEDWLNAPNNPYSPNENEPDKALPINRKYVLKIESAVDKKDSKYSYDIIADFDPNSHLWKVQVIDKRPSA